MNTAPMARITKAYGEAMTYPVVAAAVEEYEEEEEAAEKDAYEADEVAVDNSVRFSYRRLPRTEFFKERHIPAK